MNLESALSLVSSIFTSADGRAKATRLVKEILAPKKLEVGEVWDATGPDDSTTDYRIVTRIGDEYAVMFTRAKSGRVNCKSASLEETTKKFFEKYPHAKKAAATAAEVLG